MGGVKVIDSVPPTQIWDPTKLGAAKGIRGRCFSDSDFYRFVVVSDTMNGKQHFTLIPLTKITAGFHQKLSFFERISLSISAIFFRFHVHLRGGSKKSNGLVRGFYEVVIPSTNDSTTSFSSSNQNL